MSAMLIGFGSLLRVGLLVVPLESPPAWVAAVSASVRARTSTSVTGVSVAAKRNTKSM